MIREKKGEILAGFSKDLEKSEAIALFKNNGIDAESMEILRKTARKNDIQIKIVKNSILKIILKEKGYPSQCSELLSGTNFFVIGNDPIKCSHLFQQVDKNIKGKILPVFITEKNAFLQSNIMEISKMRSKTDLIGKFTATTIFPLVKLVKTLELIKNKI